MNDTIPFLIIAFVFGLCAILIGVASYFLDTTHNPFIGPGRLAISFAGIAIAMVALAFFLQDDKKNSNKSNEDSKSTNWFIYTPPRVFDYYPGF